MATQSPPNGSLTRWIVSAVALVVVVGGVTWVSQNLTSADRRPQPVPVPIPDKQADLRFLFTKSVWDIDDPTYLKELESGVEGHYDFPFLNPGSDPVTLGFGKTSCDCTSIKVVVLEPGEAAKIEKLHAANPTEFPVDPAWNWTMMTVSEKEGVQIPPGGGGGVRVLWDGRKGGHGSMPNVRPKMWMQPAGKPDQRTFATLEFVFKVADPVIFQPTRVSVGVIVVGGQERGISYAYSSTRKDLDLQVDPAKDDPLFEIKFKKFEPAELKAFEAKIADEKKGTRLLSAYRVETTVRTQKDDKLLDMGHFRRDLPILLGGHPFPLNAPVVVGFVRGEIDIGAPGDDGKVNLGGFSARDGVQKTVPLWIDGANEIVVDYTYPTTLETKLTRIAKESTASRSRWNLEVTVPPGAGYGAFTDDAIIVLRTNSTPPRRIRIPVVGTAGPG